MFASEYKKSVENSDGFDSKNLRNFLWTFSMVL